MIHRETTGMCVPKGKAHVKTQGEDNCPQVQERGPKRNQACVLDLYPPEL